MVIGFLLFGGSSGEASLEVSEGGTGEPGELGLAQQAAKGSPGASGNSILVTSRNDCEMLGWKVQWRVEE